METIYDWLKSEIEKEGDDSMIRYKNRCTIESWALFKVDTKHEKSLYPVNKRKVRHMNTIRAIFKIYHNHLSIRLDDHLHRTRSIFWNKYKYGKRQIKRKW